MTKLDLNVLAEIRDRLWEEFRVPVGSIDVSLEKDLATESLWINVTLADRDASLATEAAIDVDDTTERLYNLLID